MPRTHIVEAEVPGTPEQVWEAIATGPGITAWFVPSEVDGREGGEVVSHLGSSPDMDSRGRITAYDPPSRFAYVERWDRTIEGLDRGWRAFLDNLRIYLERFPGAPCSQAVADMHCPGEEPAVVLRSLIGALGLPEAPVVGDAVSTGGDAPPVSGIVERVGPEELALRTDDGLVLVTSFPWEGGAMARLQAYVYGPGAAERAARIEPAWRDWISVVRQIASNSR